MCSALAVTIKSNNDNKEWRHQKLNADVNVVFCVVLELQKISMSWQEQLKTRTQQFWHKRQKF